MTALYVVLGFGFGIMLTLNHVAESVWWKHRKAMAKIRSEVALEKARADARSEIAAWRELP